MWEPVTRKTHSSWRCLAAPGHGAAPPSQPPRSPRDALLRPRPPPCWGRATRHSRPVPGGARLRVLLPLESLDPSGQPLRWRGKGLRRREPVSVELQLPTEDCNKGWVSCRTLSACLSVHLLLLSAAALPGVPVAADADAHTCVGTCCIAAGGDMGSQGPSRHLLHRGPGELPHGERSPQPQEPQPCHLCLIHQMPISS